jgi:hypothetical protein
MSKHGTGILRKRIPLGNIATIAIRSRIDIFRGITAYLAFGMALPMNAIIANSLTYVKTAHSFSQKNTSQEVSLNPFSKSIANSVPI